MILGDAKLHYEAVWVLASRNIQLCEGFVRTSDVKRFSNRVDIIQEACIRVIGSYDFRLQKGGIAKMMVMSLPPSSAGLPWLCHCDHASFPSLQKPSKRHFLIDV